GHKDLTDIAGFEQRAQPGGFAMAVVEKATVTVNARIGAFAENIADQARSQRWHEGGAGRVLHAVDRPEDLGQAVEINDVAGLFAGVIGSKAAVAGGVPVLSSDHQIEMRL